MLSLFHDIYHSALEFKKSRNGGKIKVDGAQPEISSRCVMRLRGDWVNANVRSGNKGEESCTIPASKWSCLYHPYRLIFMGQCGVQYCQNSTVFLIFSRLEVWYLIFVKL